MIVDLSAERRRVYKVCFLRAVSYLKYFCSTIVAFDIFLYSRMLLLVKPWLSNSCITIFLACNTRAAYWMAVIAARSYSKCSGNKIARAFLPIVSKTVYDGTPDTMSYLISVYSNGLSLLSTSILPKRNALFIFSFFSSICKLPYAIIR